MRCLCLLLMCCLIAQPTDALFDWIKDAGNTLGNAANSLVDAALGIGSNVIGTGGAIIEKGFDMFGNAIGTVLNIGGKTLGSVIDTAVNLNCALLGQLVECRKIPGKGSVAPLPFQCRGKADIIFVVDASGSVGSLNFKKLLSFAANLAGSYLIGPDNTRFGLVVFSTGYQKVFDLNSYNSPVDVLQGILRSSYSAGSTNTDKALNSIRTNRMFDSFNGGRRDAPDIVITLTDGLSNNPTAS